MQFLKNTKIDFLKISRAAIIASVVLSVLSVVMLFVKSPNWGIDFTGGLLVHVRFQGRPDIGNLRNMLAESGIDNSSIQSFRKSQVVIIKVKSLQEDKNVADRIEEIIRNGMPSMNFEVLRSEMVGPAVGSYLKEKAVKAFIFAFMGMIIYVAWRFKGGVWGFAAVIALIHDVIVTFGILNLMNVAIDLPVVAALLTLAGYSINDSIVVYDRIRENIRLYYKKPLGEIINLSINSTLSRTIITSGTTLMVVLALFLKGGEVLYGFSTTLLFGIVIGTYSSIFVASPLVYAWQKKK
ncbi:MAG: protein translocase subunit SecF [Elusimicrobia bacterium]|nr:protein translocase subunit SecF [Elusimicrobiota bacterium]